MWHDIEIDRDGETHRGRYKVESHILTVAYRGREGSTQGSGIPSEDRAMAHQLLSEMVSGFL